MVIVAARALATYLIPGCVGRGVRLGSEGSSVGGGGVWKSRNLEIWEFGVQQIKKIKILKIQIRSVQNVGKVWISQEKILLAPFGAYLRIGSHGPKKIKNVENIVYFPLLAFAYRRTLSCSA